MGDASQTSPGSPSRRHVWRWVGLGCLTLALGSILGLASLFFLSRDARIMRDEFLRDVDKDSLHTTIQLNFGPLSTGAVRFVASHFVGMDPNAILALESLRSASVGVYSCDKASVTSPSSVERLDARMQKRGWKRIVYVRDGHDTVLLYGPDKRFSQTNLPLCLAVFDGHELVVASIKGNPAPLIGLIAMNVPH
jgi:hypothetical protein